jgi:uncharacterized membrane protein HdeD (DUF308 family)
MPGDIVSRYWWTTFFRGALWIVFGLVALVQPFTSLLALTLVFGAFAIADGVANLVDAFSSDSEEGTWLPALNGIAGVAIGLLTLFTPQITALILLLYIAVWAIVTGTLGIITAVRLRTFMEGGLSLGLGGIVSVAFGLFVLAQPVAGALATMLLISAYAIVFGGILIIDALGRRTLVRG